MTINELYLYILGRRDISKLKAFVTAFLHSEIGIREYWDQNQPQLKKLKNI